MFESIKKYWPASKTDQLKKKVDDQLEQVKGYLKVSLNLKEADVEIKDNIAIFKVKNDIPKESKEKIENKLKELTNIKKLEISLKEDKTKQ